MIDTLDETEIKKRLLAELQGQMAGRRASPLLEIEISAPGGEQDTEDATEGLEDTGAESLANSGELDEPTDVKSRLGNLLKKRGMLD